MIIYSLYSCAYFWFVSFQCGLLKNTHFWEAQLAGCSPPHIGLVLCYLHAILTASADLIFWALPLPMILRSQLNIREKVIVMGILCIAITSCIGSLARIGYLRGVVDVSLNFFNHAYFFALWSAVEPGLGIIASSIACLRPLLRRILGTEQSQSSRSVILNWTSSSNNNPTLMSYHSMEIPSTGPLNPTSPLPPPGTSQESQASSIRNRHSGTSWLASIFRVRPRTRTQSHTLSTTNLADPNSPPVVQRESIHGNEVSNASWKRHVEEVEEDWRQKNSGGKSSSRKNHHRKVCLSIYLLQHLKRVLTMMMPTRA